MDNKPFDYKKPFRCQSGREAIFYKLSEGSDYPLHVLVRSEEYSTLFDIYRFTLQGKISNTRKDAPLDLINIEEPMQEEPQFDPTKPVQQRCGRWARILATDSGGAQPIICEFFDGEGNLMTGYFFANGKWGTINDHARDLINIPEKKFELEVDKFYWDENHTNIYKIFWKNTTKNIYQFEGICVYGIEIHCQYTYTKNGIFMEGFEDSHSDLIEEVSSEQLIRLGVIKA
jgi:hypothetical protein